MTKMEFDLVYFREEIQSIHDALDAIDPYTEDQELQSRIAELGQLECDYSFEVNLLERLLKKS